MLALTRFAYIPSETRHYKSNQGHFILHLACADLTDNNSERGANKLKKIPFVRLVKPDMGETKERRAQTDAQST